MCFLFLLLVCKNRNTIASSVHFPKLINKKKKKNQTEDTQDLGYTA